MKGKNIRQWVLIGLLSLGISIVNMLRVIVGAFHIPPGFTYFASGHYFLDYFEYVQQIAQGIFGHILVRNQFTTSDPTQTLIGWGQYLLIGKFAAFLHLSPFAAYWIAVFFLSIAVCIIVYVAIKRILAGQPFALSVISFLFCFLAAPLVTVAFTGNRFVLTPYSFFYAPVSLLHRLGQVPHHLTTTIAVITILLLAADIVGHLKKYEWKKMAIKGFVVIILLLLTLTFSPLQVITVVSTVSLVSLWYSGYYLFVRKSPQQGIAFLLFLFLLYLSIIPAALGIRTIHGSQELFQRAMAWELTQEFHPALPLLMASIGPILLLVPFGLLPYLTTLTPVRLLFLVFSVFSYSYFATPIAHYFGTFNQRFLSPVPYVVFGVLAVLGIRNVVRFFPYKRILYTVIIAGFLLYFIIVTMSLFPSFRELDDLGYMPNGFVTGILELNRYNDTKAVLTSPHKALGLIVPCIVDRNVYLGRPIFTPGYDEKLALSNLFYQGKIPLNEAYQLLMKNSVGYVIFSSTDPYKIENLQKYPFLREVYKNNALTIFRFRE